MSGITGLLEGQDGNCALWSICGIMGFLEGQNGNCAICGIIGFLEGQNGNCALTRTEFPLCDFRRHIRRDLCVSLDPFEENGAQEAWLGLGNSFCGIVTYAIKQLLPAMRATNST
ncbi:hypothetical protein VNO77_20629 [Canavalia gladiata]|uniref:Uncharacterized protein n=1 Tax=Canavalia gladiata TaxID=3824 RepID=A0AAN9LQH3_CANGL